MRPPPGSTEARLEALWRRWRRPWRRLLPPHILREIALRARFELAMPDPDAIARAVPPGQVPDCVRCPDRCCGGWDNVVSLRLSDIARLIDLGRADLISRRKPRFPPEHVALRPSLRTLTETTLWRTLPVLRQVGPARTCAALTADGRCSLYPSWPASCARFPYTLDLARARVHWGTRCPVARPEPDPVHANALYEAAFDAYGERVKDAILLAHARAELDQLGLGRWLCRGDEDPFEPPPRLRVLHWEGTAPGGTSADGNPPGTGGGISPVARARERRPSEGGEALDADGLAGLGEKPGEGRDRDQGDR